MQRQSRNTLTQPVYRTIDTIEELQAVIKRAWQLGVLSFDTETTGLDVMTDTIVGLSLSVEPGEGFYVPLAHTDGQQLDLQTVLEEIAPILENPCVTKVLHHAKFDMQVMLRYGVLINGIEDTMLMSYSMNGGRHFQNMDELAAIYLKYKTTKFNEVTGGQSFDRVPIDAATHYAAEDADITLRLANEFRKTFEKDTDGLNIYWQLEQPLIPVIARMEQRGVKVSRERLDELTEIFTAKREKALDECEAILGHEFNPASGPQVAAVMERFKVPLHERTDAGAVATGADILERAKQGDISPEAKTLIGSILEWRKYAKLIGTYTKGLAKHINVETGRVHPSFGMAHTTTGRLSCSDPNIQNQPSPNKDPINGTLLRSAFICEPGNRLIAADFSQIELRILAHACGDDALLTAFEKGIDIHRMTAAKVWGGTPETVTSVRRRDAKAVNFGIIYGQTKFGLAEALKIGVDDAQRIIDDYFEAFPGIRTYMDNAVNYAKANGYVVTIAGRKVWVPDINAREKWKRGHAERAAVNAPIQGTAADVIKKAMLSVDAALTDAGFKTAMLMQVHDELVFEAPQDEVAEVMPFIVERMEQAVDYLDVPLFVDAKDGANWSEAH